METSRRLRLLARLQEGDAELDPSRLCAVGAAVTGTTGAGIMLMSGDTPDGSLGSSDDVSALIEDLQFTLGAGPCIDAFQMGRPVAEDDLAGPHEARWPAFAPPALEAGAAAVFGFPMRVGGIRLGALNLYRARPGPLTEAQHADALALADIATQSVLVLQANAPMGQVAVELEQGADFHYVVHQAAGMVAAQLEASIGHALVRLRAYAYAHDRPLDQVAGDVVSRVLRFEAGDGLTPAAQ